MTETPDVAGARPSSSEPYRVLARKYRPSTFAALIGQEAMVRTLANAFRAGRLPQAWILTGVRGVGKTTTARIIAKALNCTGRDKALSESIEPCDVCPSCRAIAEDRHVDVQELDAASRTGVDDIRELIEGVRYGPVSAQYKVYILDEVHMLSKNAFNALLKTLEEPPAHTKFIFATTEIRKVPVTVLSRCQRFDLRRVDMTALVEHFARLAALEGAQTEEEAIKLIARAADGSVRDGLSLLDQALALGMGHVRTEDVKTMLGLADRAATLDLCGHVLRGDMTKVLNLYGASLSVGADPLQILQDMAGLVHLLARSLILRESGAPNDIPEGDRRFVEDLADMKMPAVSRAWQILLKGIGEVQSAFDPASAAEMVLIRLAYAAEMPPPGDVIRQLREAKTQAPSIDPHMPRREEKREGPTGNVVRLEGSAQRILDAQVPARAVLVSQAAPLPVTFRDIVALFSANREGGLCAEISSFAHFVRLAPGVLEIRLEKQASPSLATRVAQKLSQWTGQQWMVSVVEDAGDPTLAEQDKEAEKKEREKVETHPLMQTCKAVFPDSKIVAIRPKKDVDFQNEPDVLVPFEETDGDS